jgi:hypothetical protein
MQKTPLLQTVDGCFIEPSNIVYLHPSQDGNKFRAQLRKPLQSPKYTPSRAKQFYAWFSESELRAKGIIK